MENAVQYSMGFFEGIEVNRTTFNTQLGEYIKEALGHYIDTMAAVHPEELHHVYEWGEVGDESARLFDFDVIPTQRSISIKGGFLPSGSTAPNATVPFYNKAEIMEGGIAVTISPVFSPVLVFEIDGETIFTANSVYVEHPGGDAVAGAFGRTVEDFFHVHLTGAVMKASGIFDDLENASEYADGFVGGVKGGGKAAGIKSGINYLTIKNRSIQ